MGQLNLIKNFMTKYKYAYEYAYDNLDRLITVLKLLCGIVAFTGLYFYLSAPRTQKSLENKRNATRIL